MISKRNVHSNSETIIHDYEYRVRFSEVDSLGIVWHGHYISYFEEGREAFGRTYNLTYLGIKEEGYTVPIVKMECEHKLPVKYGETIRIETKFVNTPAAKIVFEFRIYNQDNKLVCVGKSIQVFLDLNGNLSLNNPPFFENWKKANGLS